MSTFHERFQARQQEERRQEEQRQLVAERSRKRNINKAAVAGIGGMAVLSLACLPLVLSAFAGEQLDTAQEEPVATVIAEDGSEEVMMTEDADISGDTRVTYAVGDEFDWDSDADGVAERYRIVMAYDEATDAEVIQALGENPGQFARIGTGHGFAIEEMADGVAVSGHTIDGENPCVYVDDTVIPNMVRIEYSVAGTEDKATASLSRMDGEWVLGDAQGETAPSDAQSEAPSDNEDIKAKFLQVPESPTDMLQDETNGDMPPSEADETAPDANGAADVPTVENATDQDAVFQTEITDTSSYEIDDYADVRSYYLIYAFEDDASSVKGLKRCISRFKCLQSYERIGQGYYSGDDDWVYVIRFKDSAPELHDPYAAQKVADSMSSLLLDMSNDGHCGPLDVAEMNSVFLWSQKELQEPELRQIVDDVPAVAGYKKIVDFYNEASNEYSDGYYVFSTSDGYSDLQAIQALDSYVDRFFGPEERYDVSYCTVRYGLSRNEGQLEPNVFTYDCSQRTSILSEYSANASFLKPYYCDEIPYLAIMPKGCGTMHIGTSSNDVFVNIEDKGSVWALSVTPTYEAYKTVSGTIACKVSLNIDGNERFDGANRAWDVTFSTRQIKKLFPSSVTMVADRDAFLLDCKFQDVASREIIDSLMYSGTYDNVKFTSSDKSIVKVDSLSGFVEGVQGGKATVTVTATDSSHTFPPIRHTFSITVKGKKIPQIDNPLSQALVATSGNFAICTKSAGAVTAKSSNTNIATVKVAKATSNGVPVKFTAIKPGTTKITINIAGNKNYKSRKRTFTLKVVRVPTTISVNKNITKKTKNSFKVNAKVYELDAATNKRRGVVPSSNIKLTYASSNPAVASVDKNGQVTTKKAGTATITVKSTATATYAASSAKMTVTVTK